MPTLLVNWDLVVRVIRLILSLLPQIVQFIKEIEKDDENNFPEV